MSMAVFEEIVRFRADGLASLSLNHGAGEKVGTFEWGVL